MSSPVCPDCGGPKSAKAKRCRGCAGYGGGARAGAGRPSTLTAKTKGELIKHLKTGMPIAFSCGRAGVLPATYQNWVSRAADLQAKDEEGHPLTDAQRRHRDDVDDLVLARHYGGGWLYEQLLAAPANIWQKYSAALERQFHDYWSTRFGSSTLSATRGKDGTVEVKFSFQDQPDLVDQLREK